MNVEILGTIKASRLDSRIQILKTKTQRKFVNPCCHAHYYAHSNSPTYRPKLDDTFEQFLNFVLFDIEILEKFRVALLKLDE